MRLGARGAGGGGGGGGSGAPSPLALAFASPEERVLLQATFPSEAMRWRRSSPKKAAPDAATARVVAAGGRVVREGFLVKKGHVLRTQKERFFVLRQHSLSYFRARRGERTGGGVADSGTLRGVLELAPTDIVTPAPHSELWFRMQKLPDASGKSYKIDLKAATAVERHEWIDALRSACRSTLLLKQQAMHTASVRLHHSRATAVRHSRDATILSARVHTTLPAVLAEDARAAPSVADLRASFMILHELALLQQLVETVRTSWGPAARWTVEQYQALVQSISLAQEKTGASRLEDASILAEAFALRYRFEEEPANQPKIREIHDAQQAEELSAATPRASLSRESSHSLVLPPGVPRLRCPTIYGYYSTFEELAGAIADGGASPSSAAGGRSSAGALPLTPRSATIAKYAHLYLEGDLAGRLCDRFSRDQIYAYVSDHTMVLLNPHRVLQTSKFTSIYDEHVVLTYALTPSAQTRLAPHPFAMAKHGLLRLFHSPEHARETQGEGAARVASLLTQSVFLSGESGSGKTELAKELLKYFVLSAQPTYLTAQGSRPKVKLFTSSTKSTTQMRTEETRTMALLEAKGVDAYEIVLLDLFPERWAEMTSVSRSKRIPQVHIDGLFFGFYEKLESLEDEEQLRISEANFHVFYALVSGVNAAPCLRLLAKDLRLVNTTSESFAFLGKRKHKLPGLWTEAETWKKDVERWQHILDAMNTMGLTAEQQRAIFQVLSAVLWLGNVEFRWDSATKKLAMVSPPDQDAAANVVELLGFESQERLERLLFTKHITLASTGESFGVALERGQVAHLRDSLARLLYQCAFVYLVEQMNDATSEQRVATWYSGAAIPTESHERSILDLFEHPLGIFASLEELTVLHQGENESWQQEHKRNELLVRNLYERNSARLLEPPRASHLTKRWLPFAVPHSRKSVVYDASDFVKKNSDFQPPNLLEGLAASSNEHICAMVATMKAAAGARGASHKKARATTFGGSQVNQFRAETQALTARESHRLPLYMHCVRPNSSGRAFEIEKEVVERQVQAHQLVTQVRLHQQSVTDASSVAYVSMAISKDAFVTRYQSLLGLDVKSVLPSDDDLQRLIHENLLSSSEEEQGGASSLLNIVISPERGVQFESAETVERLDVLLEVRQLRAAVTLQSFARMVAHRRSYQAKQGERSSLRTELVDLYGAANSRKVERTLNKYRSNEAELRAKIAAKKQAVAQAHKEAEQLAHDLKALCLSSEGGLRAETVNELLSDANICGQLQQNERIVAALRDMSLDPGVLTTQLADPVLRAFYQSLVRVLREKQAAAAVARAQDDELEPAQRALDERVQLLVASAKALWDAEAARGRWSDHADKLEEVGDDPELLVFHLEDAAFVAALEDFVATVEAQRAMMERDAVMAARLQAEAARAEAQAAEVEAELLAMLLKVELDESLMAAMRQDAYFVAALTDPVLIASMQQFAASRTGFASQGELRNPVVRDFFLRLITLSLRVQEQES
ncbi:hypothetical protein PybrP1_005732 [[Pythium] brassicae (nom. inval.)]|nr:hypothetical protein PybrP1_005732 [[Pythium] brassicae (nom. inval.)]